MPASPRQPTVTSILPKRTLICLNSRSGWVFLLFEAGKFSRAEACLEGAINKSSNKETVLCLLGDVLDEAGKPEEAELRYREAADLRPNWAEPWHRIGLLAEKRDAHEETLEAFEKALELDPTHSAAMRDRRLLLLDAGQVEEGAATLAAANLGASDWHAVATRADSIYRKKRYSASLKTFRISHALDSERFESRLGIFLCMQHLGRVEEALSGFLEIEADFPDRNANGDQAAALQRPLPDEKLAIAFVGAKADDLTT